MKAYEPIVTDVVSGKEMLERRVRENVALAAIQAHRAGQVAQNALMKVAANTTGTDAIRRTHQAAVKAMAGSALGHGGSIGVAALHVRPSAAVAPDPVIPGTNREEGMPTPTTREDAEPFERPQSAPPKTQTRNQRRQARKVR